MLDFTSALYLGMRHPHRSLRSWAELTTGRPAALEAPREAQPLVRDLARLLGQEDATLGTSTLHLFWDLFDVLARDRIAIYTDSGAYPIARWGIERVAAKGVPTNEFKSHDPAALEALLNRDRKSGYRPVVVADGLCPATGRTAPLPQYLELVRARAGYLVIDDTQALGILGHGSTPGLPYGSGGAGSAAWHGIGGPELIVVSSLAKGLGAPLATLAANAQVVAKFEALSACRMHCSPPSFAAIGAGQRALMINAGQGDDLRARLLTLVRRLRHQLHEAGIAASGGFFPVQTLKPVPEVDAATLHDRLSDLGVRTVLHRSRNGGDTRLSFLISTAHSAADIDAGIDALRAAWALTWRKRQNLPREPAPGAIAEQSPRPRLCASSTRAIGNL
jgi:8-amino-7-oxononanoate synthase